MAEEGNPEMLGDEKPEDATWLSPKLVMFKNKRLSNAPNSNVYGGRQEYFGGNFKDVAIKLIQHTDDNMKRIQILAQLNHPNIVQYVDVGTHLGAVHWIYIVMEPCSMNLEEYIQRHQADSKKATAFFQQLASAVDYLHAQNITHQNLKPANVLVSKCGNFLKVADFRLGKQVSDDPAEAEKASQGTVIDGFKAPEIYAQNYDVLPSSDIFSLGLVSAYLLTHGKHPFGDDPFLWVYNIRNTRKTNIAETIPSDIPKRNQLIRVIAKMLQHEPHERLTARKIMEDPYFTE